MAGRAFLVLLISLWAATALSMSVFYSSPKAHMLLRTKRANSFLEEIKPPSLERECVEERCDFEEAREIFQTRESTLEFWTRYVDGNQCVPNPCENGRCVDQYQSYICDCFLGFEGKFCHIQTTSFNCSVNNGDCNQECLERKDKTGRFCGCIPGYQLHENAKNCTPKSQDSCGQILIAKSAFSTKPRPILQPWLVGAEVGRKGDSPWQALILNAKGKFHCGGVLIDESWILTAAHCLETSLRFSVRLGDYLRFKKEDSEVTIPVSKIVSHPKYNPVTVDNDIALLRLATPVKFTNYILPACLPSRSLAERVLHLNGTQTVVTGWGKQNETATHYSSALGFINIPLVDHAECARHMVNNLTQNVLCAGIIGKVRDACEGDSGGPMMTQYHNTWFLIGLVSWGEGCGHTDKLGIYTKVSNYLEWIDSVRKEATGP
ncbi:vitamin K-dependent protein C-like isoform X1 [Pygocentrus nattereri]|uniref:Vitamin K-dependent protein C n=1 Tax=Pygocentrus nattereri TaxID=42514 RepID=A0A3B4C281_PYGNA|nr:vitamin K-dependent protein C-like isoform X1 [Pygocentrus nattereri]